MFAKIKHDLVYISKRQSNFSISRGFKFHKLSIRETSSQNIPNLPFDTGCRVECAGCSLKINFSHSFLETMFSERKQDLNETIGHLCNLFILIMSHFLESSCYYVPISMSKNNS